MKPTLPKWKKYVLVIIAVLCCGVPPGRGQAKHSLRIVALTAPAAELMYTLGADDELVGVSDSCVSPDKLMDDRRNGRVRVIGAFTKIDITAVEILKPDLIITGTSYQRDLMKALEARGHRVLHIDPSSLEEVFSSFDAIGAAIGKQDEAKRFTAGLRAEVRAIEAESSKLPPVFVYVELNHVGPWTTGRKSFVSDVIRVAGGRNIFADIPSGAFQTTNDEIRKRNPQIILSPIWPNATIGGITGITTVAEIDSRRGFRDIAAVRNSRVLYYDSALVKQGGPREVLAIRKLAHLFHPKEFPDPAGTVPWELGRIE